jgi:hypothetical protein
MRTDRRDALGARGLDTQQMAAIGCPGHNSVSTVSPGSV